MYSKAGWYPSLSHGQLIFTLWQEETADKISKSPTWVRGRKIYIKRIHLVYKMHNWPHYHPWTGSWDFWKMEAGRPREQGHLVNKSLTTAINIISLAFYSRGCVQFVILLQYAWTMDIFTVTVTYVINPRQFVKKKWKIYVYAIYITLSFKINEI